VLECCRLRVQDVDFARNQIVVRGSKGGKDRMTMLPASVKATLARHLVGVQEQHRLDLAPGAGWVELPTALARKYPNAGRKWAWQWVSPATRIYTERTRAATRSPRTSSRTSTTSGPSRSPRPPRPRDHADLHPRPQPRPVGGAEPGRCNARGVTVPSWRFARSVRKNRARRYAAVRPRPIPTACDLRRVKVAVRSGESEHPGTR
jgi:hypothetical protein